MTPKSTGYQEHHRGLATNNRTVTNDYYRHRLAEAVARRTTKVPTDDAAIQRRMHIASDLRTMSIAAVMLKWHTTQRTSGYASCPHRRWTQRSKPQKLLLTVLVEDEGTMPKLRNKENLGLPLRWQHVHGAYYYRVPPGLEAMWDGKKVFRLGTKLNEASQVWADRMAQVAGPNDVRNIEALLDRYAREVIPTKAPASQTSNLNQLPKLREVFGTMPLLPFKPQLIYQYVDQRGKKKQNPITGKVTGGKIAAHREVELLSHAYTKAVEWGYIDRHPFKNEVRLGGERPRERYVEDWEIVECLKLPAVRKAGSVLMIQAYLRIKLLTGMAQGDLLRLQPDLNIKEDGIHIQRHKTATSTGKRTIYDWTPELRAAVDLALQARPVASAYLFCNRDGAGYIDEAIGRASGWKSMWQRFLVRVIKETKVEQPFTEHDLRAKVSSDADSLEHARALLSHADSRTTNRVYRRKAERVSPLR